ncbi:ClpP/crotonase-like domain-containing protein [Xylogone sp. PMI_703]|nr:ClpP/crotonase-like domain-containing protein [Xylogone sp. PMI_703]
MSPVTVDFSTRTNGIVATITVSNPQKLNSLNSPILDALVASITSLENKPNLRCVVLTGGECTTGRAFIGGADISEMMHLPNAEAARTFITKMHIACKALRDLPVPVIARVNGHALGGGLAVMAATDMRIARSDALFGMPEVQRGVPSTAESALLPLQIGYARARRLLLLGDTISASQAEQWGLVDRVVEPSELDKAVEEWVELVLSAGPRALQAQKELLAVWEQVSPEQAIKAGIWEFGKAFETEGLEAEGRRMMNEFSAWNQKRKTKL